MKKRKIVMSVLIVTMLASCMACGNIKDHKDENLKNSVTEKVTVSDKESNLSISRLTTLNHLLTQVSSLVCKTSL